MLKKIYAELVAIRKELQSIRRAMELFQKPLTIDEINHQLGRNQTRCDHACFSTSDANEAPNAMISELAKKLRQEVPPRYHRFR